MYSLTISFLTGLLGLTIQAPSTPLQSAMIEADSHPQVGLTAGKPAMAAQVPPGLVLKAKNWISFSSANVKAGKKIRAQVIEDALADGKVVVPRKSMLIGHIEEVQKKDRTHDKSRLLIVFDSVRIHRKTIPITGFLEEIWFIDHGYGYESYMDCSATFLGDPCPERLGKRIPSPGMSMFLWVNHQDTDRGALLVSRQDIELATDTQLIIRVAPPAH